MTTKVLGQSAPSATTLTDLYTVPSGKSAVTSTLAICNRSGAAITYRVAIRPSGASIANAHYVAYGVNLPANSADYMTVGFTLGQGDVVSVWASDGNSSWSLFGDES